LSAPTSIYTISLHDALPILKNIIMKNIILAITLLYISIACVQERIIDNNNRPQNYVPKKGDYIVNNGLNDFEGTFIWENSSKDRSEEHTSELQSRENLVCRL